MEFLPDPIASYCEVHTSAESNVLAALNRYTQSHVLMPRMLSGHLQGRALAMFSKMIRPKYILEIGTYTGYSAICLAEGLQPDGTLVSIDNNEELFDIAQKYITDAGFKDSISLVTGDAAEEISKYNFDWDLVFIDADKERYSLYYDMLIDALKPGGIILADNVLWSGKVTDQTSLLKDKQTQLLDAFNRKVNDDPRVENILFPLRDGLMMIRKKG